MFYWLLLTQLAEQVHNHDREVCNNNLLYASVCNKTLLVQSGDWIHAIWLAQRHMISNNVELE